MKNITQLSAKAVSLVWMFILMLLLVACSDGVPKYARLISRDANLVARLDVRQMADKASDGRDSRQPQQIKSLIDKMGLSGQAATQLKAIIDDPAKSGVDLRRPLFVFDDQIGGQRGASFVGKLHNSGQFAQTLQSLAGDLGATAQAKDGDLQVMELPNGVLAFDDDYFYIATTPADAATTKGYIKQRFAATEDQSVMARDDFKDLCKLRGDAQLLFSRDAWRMMPGRTGTEQPDWLPDGVTPHDISYLFDLNFDKGEVALDVHIQPLTDKAKAWLDGNDAAMGKVDGKLLAYVPGDALMAVALNIDGARLYQAMEPTLNRNNPGAASSDYGQKLKGFVSAIKGNAVLWVKASGGRPEVAALFETRDAQATDAINAYLEEEGIVRPAAGGQYQTLWGGYAGVSDGVCYINTPQPYGQLAKADQPIDRAPFDGYPAAATLNLTQLTTAMPGLLTASFVPNYGGGPVSLIRACKSLDMQIASNTEFSFRLKLNDTKRNALQVFADLAGNAV